MSCYICCAHQDLIMINYLKTQKSGPEAKQRQQEIASNGLRGGTGKTSILIRIQGYMAVATSPLAQSPQTPSSWLTSL